MTESIYSRKRQMIRERKEQEALKEKYDIEEDVIIKETDNMGKFLIRTSSSIIRLLANIILAILAAIGITALAYPTVRQELISVVTAAIESIF